MRLSLLSVKVLSRGTILLCSLICAGSALAQIAIDAHVSANRSSASVNTSSPSFATASSNELLLAFVAADYLSGANTTVASVAGGGLTWTLVVRTNKQSGDSEIWRAFAPSPLSNTSVTATLSHSVLSSITVVSFTGVDTSGAGGSGAIGAITSANASSGGPSATLVTTRNGSWIFGVANDYDNAIARTPASGQTVLHQDLTSAGDTYWVQMQNTPTPLSGTTTGIDDTAPTSDRYNLSICEILPAASATQTWSISGSITPVSLGSGAAVALSGTADASTSADSNGNYTFTGLANGPYTLTPTKNSYTFQPASQPVTIDAANAAGIDFTVSASGTTGTAALAIDANVSTDQTSRSSAVTSPSFSTASANELLLAFVATDYLSGANTTVKNIAGGGLAWTLAVRTNKQSGDAEVWRAFAPASLDNVSVTATLSQSIQSSLTVVSFTGADATGAGGAGAIGATAGTNANSGAPSASLLTTRNNSWIFGVGNDYANALPRTPGLNQSVIHQDLTSAGDTYWVQMESNPIAAAGTEVTINDTAPGSDSYNLSIVEVLPAFINGIPPTPPSVMLTAPAPGGTVSGKTTLVANATSANYPVTGVQFELDGNNLGSPLSAPYWFTWDTETATAGTHTLAAIATNSAGLTATSNTITVTVDNSGSPATVGSWSNPVQTPAVAVNLILLPNNKLLFYQDGASPTVWDYTNNVFTSISTSQDVFCSGHAALADGRILVVGGYGEDGNNIGIDTAEIFDPSTNSWTSVPKMSYKRWYPTATTLSDGRVLVTAGWQTTNHSNAGIPEIYDPASNSWTKLTNANNPFETYPFIFLLPDGRIIHTGGSEYATVTDILDLASQSWSVVDSTVVDGGSAKMYLPDEIMKAGSAADSQMTGPSSNTTYILDMTQQNPKWQETPPMAYPRSFLNLTELPDGTVLATGGDTDKNGGDIANAVYA
ncbi:MAG: Ig-like domain-containing protein, partial [Bryobacteraceae bacterium]